MLIDGKRSPRRISCSPTSVCSSTVVPSSTQSCNADSTSATPTLAACLGLAFISLSIARKATSMCTELAAALAVPRTRISPATCVLGKDLIIILGRSSESYNPFFQHLQTIAAVPSGVRQILLAIQCNEDGPCTAGTPLGGGQTLGGWLAFCRIRCLSGRTGKFHTIFASSVMVQVCYGFAVLSGVLDNLPNRQAR